ncbi:Hypothetical protein GLP15_3491 [Giardia lamblia P15]|uniref:Uncharacterized protein n=1 Tax=Giardia intestinalis (strain P15) TaxID=658858 RepID=E1F0G0_GIAIA|nr:Hypothetical protein GLP15_3491 [Giardia lamblia P15]
MQKVTAFIDDGGVLRQCPGNATVALVDALTRKGSPVVVVQTDDGIVSQVLLQDCTHATVAGAALYLFDKDVTLLVLLFQSQTQATKFTETVAKYVKLLGVGGLNVEEALHGKKANPDTDCDQEAQILEILRDPSFPEYVDAVEKILCRMIVTK